MRLLWSVWSPREVEMSKEFKILVSVVATAVVVVLSAWGWRFLGVGIFSSTTNDWAAFGSFFGGLLGPFFSLATIVYLIWSFRKQTVMMNEQVVSMKHQTKLMSDQIKKTDQINECQLLVEEIKELIEKFGVCCTKPACLAEISSEFFSTYFKEKKEIERVDRYTVIVDDNHWQLEVVQLLIGLETKSDTQQVKDFLEKIKGGQIGFELSQANLFIKNAMVLTGIALERGAQPEVLKSYFEPWYEFVRALNRWGYCGDSVLIMYNLLFKLPYARPAQEKFYDNFVLNNFKQSLRANIDDCEVKFKLNVEEKSFEVTVTNCKTNEKWKLMEEGGWKKAS